jgi:hypothetical protein
MNIAKRAAIGLSLTVVAAGALLSVGVSPASAAAPTGGCWVYSPTSPGDMEDTVPASSTSTSLAPWADAAGPAADYVLTSNGATTVGGTRNFELTFNVGPKNGGPPASGTVHYYFSVNGTNLPVISKAFSAPGGGTIPGDTITGSFTITSPGATSVKLRKVYYDIPAYLTRVACNGQGGGTGGGVNPATTPLDTNIVSGTFTATGPSAVISAISDQVVTNAARKNDVISFSVNTFSGAGTGTASICDSVGASCDALTSTLAIDGAGDGTGTLAVANAPTTGARTLKVVSGGDTALTPITILGAPTIDTNVVGGGAGSTDTVTGTNWDPNQSVDISSTTSGPPFPPAPTVDPAVVTTANAAGNITTTFTVQAANTAYIGGSRTHAVGPPPVVIFASKGFTFSGDACNAKVGAATTGSCKLLETVDLVVTAGNLTMSKASGNVQMSGVTLNGTAQTSTGNLKDVTVKDYRGGVLGWTLVARFSGLSGPATPTTGNFTVPSTSLSWTPTCAADAGNNDDTVTTGTAGAVFTTATTDVPVCAVTGVANFGADLTSGGDTVISSPLSLAIPSGQRAGAYTGTIQFTLS